MKVWTVIIEHKYGRDVSVHASEEEANENVAQFARDWWTDFQEDLGMTAEAYEAEYGRSAMIRAYFEAENGRGGSENADITEHELWDTL